MRTGRDIMRALAGPALLALVLAGGYLMIVLPTRVIEQYQRIAEGNAVLGMVYLTMVLFGAALMLAAAGYMVWRLVEVVRPPRAERRPPPSALSRAEKEAEIRGRIRKAQRAVDRAPGAPAAAGVAEGIAELERKAAAGTLEIVAFGTVSSGKSAILNAIAGEERFHTDPRGGSTLQSQDATIELAGGGSVVLRDTPGLGEVLGGRRADLARKHARDADLVLFVVSGAMRDYEFAALKGLAAMEKRTIVCLNKEDWYTDEDREVAMTQLRELVRGLVGPEDVVAVRARPVSRRVVRVLADGSERQETVPVPPDVGALVARMTAVLKEDGRDLLLSNLVLRSRAVADESRRIAKKGGE